MTWFLVMLEANEPTARKPPATKKRPEVRGDDGAVVRVTEIVDGDPQREREHQRDADEQPTRPGIFRSTACHKDSGCVSSSSMVPFRRSSAHSRMEIAGASNRYSHGMK